MDLSKHHQVLAYNELVSLPIIVSDWDAIAETKRRASAPAQSNTGANQSSATSECPSARTERAASVSPPQHHKWSTGFTNFTDEVWSRMTGNMKRKLREACVEVLKRTDDTEEKDKMRWQYDEDARFLD